MNQLTGIVSCAYENELGNKVAAGEYYGLNNSKVVTCIRADDVLYNTIITELKQNKMRILTCLGNQKSADIKANGGHG